MSFLTGFRMAVADTSSQTGRVKPDYDQIKDVVKAAGGDVGLTLTGS